MKTPAVSVLVPTYNYARFLPDGIESVLAQDFSDFELIIVDDCSRDNTAEVVKPFCARDPRVSFIANESNRGMVNNWNDCIERARGTYIKFLFGDDKLCHPSALGKMVELLERHPSAVLAASARVVMDENSKPLEVWKTLPGGCHKGRDVIAEYLKENGRNLVGEPSSVMFRKRDAARGFNTKFRQVVDMEMWFHLLERGDLAYTREPLCGFRVHARQQSEVNSDSGLGADEHSFFYDYAVTRDWIPREAVIPLLFHLHRHLNRRRRKNTAEIALDLPEYELRLMERAGPWWRAQCRVYYIRYRFAKMWRRWRDSSEQRAFRNDWKPWPANTTA